MNAGQGPHDDIQRFFEGCHDLLATADHEFRLKTTNPAWTQALGFSAEELRGRPFFDLAIEAEREPLARIAAELDQKGEPVRWSGQLVAKDGAVGFFVWSWSRSRDGAERFGVIRQANALDDLRSKVASGSRLHTMVESAPVAIVEMDLTGVISAWNPGAERLWGYSAEEALGRPMSDLIGQHEEARASIVEQLSSLAGVARGTGETQTKGGQTRVCDWSVALLWSEQREVVGSVSIALDVTERAQAEAEMQRHIEVIEQQRDELRALSTPILQVWDEVLALPLIGRVDAGRVEAMMDALLGAIASRRARFAILDLTGVEELDEAAADRVLSVMSATRLLGAQAILTGIRPQVASRMTHLGVDLSGVVSLSSLRDAIAFAIGRRGERGRAAMR